MSAEKELIKQRMPISSLIGKYVSLKHKSGSNYFGLCPFHNEKTPSFAVSDSKAYYHCFGCGVHGDIFSFYMEIEKIDYITAIRRLAKEVGVILKKEDNSNDKKLKQYHAIYEAISIHYQQNLYSDKGKEALDYLRLRGLSEETIKRYRLGVSLDYNEILYVLKNKFNEQDILACGALRKGKMNMYDPFAKRIIFPILNREQQVIAFGGRIITINSNEEVPKYINSADSPLFKKSHMLYGLHSASKFIIKEKTAIVVEGYMDVISLANCGFNNVVAPLGTSVTVEQVEMLWKISNNIIIAMDGDKAGIQSMLRFAHIVLPVLQIDKYCRFCLIPDKMDPDEVVRKKGNKCMHDLIDKAVNLGEFLFMQEKKNFNLEIPEGKAALQSRLAEIAGMIKDAALSREFLYYLNVLYWQEIKRAKKNSAINTCHIPIKKEPHTPFAELIALLLVNPEFIEKSSVMEALELFDNSDQNLGKIRNAIFDYRELKQDEKENSLLSFLASHDINIDKISDLMAKFKSASLDGEELMNIIVARCQKIEIEKQLELIKERIALNPNEKDFQTMRHLLEVLKQLKIKI